MNTFPTSMWLLRGDARMQVPAVWLQRPLLSSPHQWCLMRKLADVLLETGRDLVVDTRLPIRDGASWEQNMEQFGWALKLWYIGGGEFAECPLGQSLCRLRKHYVTWIVLRDVFEE